MLDRRHIKRLDEFLAAEPEIAQPITPTAPPKPRPGRPGPTTVPKPGTESKPMASTETKPAPVIPATPTRPRPGRPGPTTVPKPGTESKPMAVLTGILDMFFDELNKIKRTPKGQKMIKKLHNKYAKR